jgi:DNA repair protein RecO (recombination protein O)
MHITTPAIILASRPHAEHGAVVRLLTADDGLRAGYVPGGRGSKLRPVLAAGNRVLATLRARSDQVLAGLFVEPIASRALLAFDPAAAAALDWLTRLCAAVLPENEPHPALYAALDATLDAMAGPVAGWAGAVPRFELLLLADLGFGLDLAVCAISGARDGLAFVSPKTGRAVTAAAVAGRDWAGKLLPLPGFLLDGGAAGGDLAAALALTARFLPRLPGIVAADLQGARARFGNLAGPAAAP